MRLNSKQIPAPRHSPSDLGNSRLSRSTNAGTSEDGSLTFCLGAIEALRPGHSEASIHADDNRGSSPNFRHRNSNRIQFRVFRVFRGWLLLNTQLEPRNTPNTRKVMSQKRAFWGIRPNRLASNLSKSKNDRNHPATSSALAHGPQQVALTPAILE